MIRCTESFSFLLFVLYLVLLIRPEIFDFFLTCSKHQLSPHWSAAGLFCMIGSIWKSCCDFTDIFTFYRQRLGCEQMRFFRFISKTSRDHHHMIRGHLDRPFSLGKWTVWTCDPMGPTNDRLVTTERSNTTTLIFYIFLEEKEIVILWRQDEKQKR